MVKATIILAQEDDDALDVIARREGINRSGVVRQMIRRAMSSLPTPAAQQPVPRTASRPQGT
jgi:hypothetical protein